MFKFLKRAIILFTLFIFAICILTACNKTIKFKLNFIVDGAIYFTIDTEGNNTIELPTNPTKEGYFFDGWYWDENTWQRPFTANSLLDAPLSSDINVYAKFNHNHSDNDWLIISTIPATEDTDGYINYICQVCSETKTETINKLVHVHNYSTEWSKNTIQHWRECIKDGDKVDLADHIYDLSEILLQPTEDTTGTIKYTCSTCNYSKTETLEKLPHTHKYSSDWQTNSTQHWHECPKDGDKSNIANHDYDNGFITKDPTEFDYGEIVYTCLVCEYKKSEQLPKLIIDRSGAELLNAEGFAFVDNNGKISLSNATETYSFINQITVSDYATWTISTDIYGINTIVTKTIPLAIGDNVVYLLITSGDGNNISLYTMTIRRRPIYTVSFNTGIETTVPNQYIEETYCASEPIALHRDGYKSYAWDHSFENPIMQETTINAIWTPNTNTKYQVEYYHQNLENDDFSLITTDTLEGTTDTIINANIKEYQHFTLNETISTLSGNLNGDESTVLKVYYNRNSYKVTISSTANVTINNPIDGYYKYGYTIPSTTATFNNFLGYDYLGWFKNDVYISDHTIPSFGVNETVEYIAKDKIRDDISSFAFTSTTKECIITGLLNKTLTDVDLPNYATEISEQAFSNCNNLTNIKIPNSITGIGSGAFTGCSSLESMTLPFVGESASATSASSNTLFGYIFGTSSYEGGVSTKQTYNGYSYTTYHIPSSLKSVTITGGKNLFGAFYGCENLISIQIPDSVTSIGDYAFRYCSSLTSVTIPDSVTSIGWYAFEGCSSLTSVTIGSSVTSIGSDAFYDCPKLVEVYNLSTLSITKGSSSDGYVGYYAKNVYTTTSGESKLSTDSNGYIIYTDGKEKILIGYTGNETELTLPKDISEIYKNAFRGCSSLTSVTIGNSVTSIGSSAFYNCTSLTSVDYTGTIDQWVQIKFGSYSSNPIYYAKNLYISNELVTEANITTATSINAYAFYGCSSLTRVVIPDLVTSIGSYAFEGCSSLTSVTIGDSVTSIGRSAFEGCSSLTSVVIPDLVTSIEDDAFRYCSSLTSVVIGNSVTSIGWSAFYGCSSLTSVTIGNSVTSIGNSAFYGCSSLTSVVIGDSVTSIGGSAFSGCSSLTRVVIPDLVTSIGSYAFCDCTSLTSVTIGNSVTSIGDYAFYKCSSLTSITFEDPTTWYYTPDWLQWDKRTGGSRYNVSSPTKNAEQFVYYKEFYWYKK